jgi:hypothetical protein
MIHSDAPASLKALEHTNLHPSAGHDNEWASLETFFRPMVVRKIENAHRTYAVTGTHR